MVLSLPLTVHKSMVVPGDTVSRLLEPLIISQDTGPVMVMVEPVLLMDALYLSVAVMAVVMPMPFTDWVGYVLICFGMICATQENSKESKNNKVFCHILFL